MATYTYLFNVYVTSYIIYTYKGMNNKNYLVSKCKVSCSEFYACRTNIRPSLFMLDTMSSRTEL